jgi:hypothetical protein
LKSCAATILRHEHRVAVRAEVAGAAQPPARRGDRPRVDRLNRRGEELDALEKERALLGKVDGESLVRRDHRDIRLDLREIGVDRRVDGRVLVRRVLHIEPAVARRRTIDERPIAASTQLTILFRRDVRRGDDVTAARQSFESADLVEVANEAVLSAGELVREDLIAAIARQVAVEDDAPHLRIPLLVTERRERHAHLEDPAIGSLLCRRIPEDVRR